MLQIFRVNQLFNSLLLLPYALLLNHRLFFVTQQDYPSGTDGLIAGGFEYFNNQYPLSASLMLILLLFIQALILNRISIIFRIGNESNLFPGMIYLIICSFFPAFQYLSGLVVGQFFFLLAVYCLFDTYKRHRDIGNLFNSAFWMSLASMYYTPFFIGLLLILIGGFILKSMKGRDFLLILNGLLVPYFLMGTVYYLKGDLWQFINHYLPPDLTFHLVFIPLTTQALIPMMLLAVAIMVVLVNYPFYRSKKGLRSKKNIEIIYILLLLQGLSTLIFPDIGLQHMILLAVPLALLLQDSLLRIENQLTAEIVHLFLLSTLFFFQYQSVFGG